MSIDVNTLLTQGKRDLVCGEIVKAVEGLQKAVELLSSDKGEFDDSLANPYLLYGTSLLELSRMESSVIGNALDGIPEDDESDSDTDLVEQDHQMTNEEKEDISNQVIDAMCVPEENGVNENNNNDADEKDAKQSEDDGGDSDSETDEKVNGEDCESGKESETNDKSAQEETQDDNNEEEDANSTKSEVTNLQLAWEVIEVAKNIFSKNDSDQNKLNIADCLEKLGEISREKEDYEQAVADLKESMSIRLSILGCNDRRIAESHFQLGTTYAVAGDLDQASSAFRSSADCLKRHIKELEDKLVGLSNDSEEFKLIDFSLKEIKDLIPDIESRIADIEEDRLADKVKMPENGSTSIVDKSNLPADDINYLVRKKRVNIEKVDDAVVGNGLNGCGVSPVSKKVKLDENGVTTTNGVHE